MNLRFLPLYFFFFFFALSLSAQNTDTKFGKNRIQFHDDFDNWLQYETPNFITYWYGKARNVGQAAVQIAELDHDAIQNTLEHRINDKIELIVYGDITDLKQSNIGSEEVFMNVIGQTKIVGNKVFIYFNGDHKHLRKQIRQGIASVYLNSMLFGSNLQEIVQNAVMMNLPEWFKQGLVSFVGEEWNSELDNRLKDALLNEDFKNFDELVEQYPALIGHSMWFYLSQNYGKSTVSNLLYLTRINRSIESGFLYVLGNSYERTLKEWKGFYLSRYLKDEESRQPLTEGALAIKNKRNIPYTNIKLSPDGNYLSYVVNEIGKYKVFLYDLATDKNEMIFKGSFRNPFQETDYDYPLLAWKPNGEELSILYEKRDIAKFLNYNLSTKQTYTEDLDPQYTRVLSMDYLNNTDLVFSAIVLGYSDLFVYQTLNRQTKRITQDYYDDLDVNVVNLDGQRGVLFASNRQSVVLEKVKMDTLLPLENMDIFYMNLDETGEDLVRITNTPYASESNPIAHDEKWFSFLSDENGVRNRASGFLEEYLAYREQLIKLKDGTEIIIHEDSTLVDVADSLIVSNKLRPVYKKRAVNHFNTNLNRNIKTHNLANGKVVDWAIINGQHKLFVNAYDPETKTSTSPTVFMQLNMQEALDLDSNQDTGSVLDPVLKEEVKPMVDSTEVDIDNYTFQSEFDELEETPLVEIDEESGEISLKEAVTESLEDEEPKVLKFKPGRIVPYRVKFRTDFLTTKLDNELLFEGLESYSGLGNEYSYQPPGILLKTNFKDLFEDYVFEAGVRVPTTFNGAEYFLLFDDKKTRMDKRYALYRKVRRETDNSGIIQLKTEFITMLGQAEFRWPLDIFTSLRARATIRNDRVTELATDANSLSIPNANQQRAGFRLEYVFDNTMDISVNIKNGTRYKIYGELVKRFSLSYDDKFAFETGEGIMTILGFDARHYQRLDRHSIFAARLAGSTSFGSEKILNYLGGTNNWLFADFNNEIPIPPSGEFAYQTVGTNIRGFSQNIRNGNSIALLNAELRVPIFRYFSRKNLRSNFLRNFQLMGFFDVGTAWHGANPFRADNPLNIVTIASEGNPVVVRVNYYRDPIVAGYGVGMRCILFGYFVRLDYGWGIETKQIQDPRLHFSLGVDF